MAGHSHWAGIKHKKGIADAKRGKLFSKLSKNIMIAIKDNGGNIDTSTNLKLRYAIDKAKEANMPKVNIERAIKKAAGLGSGSGMSEIVYEGYGAGGVAVMVEAITDNRNRTASEIRNIFDTKGGKMGASGCVSYLFSTKGVIQVAKSAIDEEKLMDIALEAGAEDLTSEDEEVFEITTEPGDLENVKKALEKAKIETESAELVKIPQNTVTLDEQNARKVFTLMEALEDNDDVENVYSNYDISEEIMAKIIAE